MTLSMISLAHPVDIAMVRTPEDMQKFEHGSRLRVLFSSQILPKVCFAADDLHYTLLVGTASCKVFTLRFHLSEPFSGVQGKDVAEIARSDIHINERRECFSFELVGRDARGTHVCFGCTARYLRLCFLPHTGVSEATAVDIKPAVSISKAFTQLLKIETIENVIRLRAFAGGRVITLCDSGLLALWDLGRHIVVAEAEAFTQRCAMAQLELYHSDSETIVVVGYPEERNWIVAVYQIIDKKFELLTELPGDAEAAASIAINQKGVYILWKSGEGATRLQAIGLDGRPATLHTAELDRQTDSILDSYTKDSDLMSRIIKPQRFSKGCFEETIRVLSRQNTAFGLSYHSLPGLIKTINPSISEGENVKDFLETCKTVQSKVTEQAESVCCSPEPGDFPLVIAYSHNAIGLLAQTGSKKERDSLLVESLSNKFVGLAVVWKPDLAQELKSLGLERLCTLLLVARIVRKRYCPVLNLSTFSEFAAAIRNLLEIAISPGLQNSLLNAASPQAIRRLEEEIQTLSQLAAEPKSSLNLRKTKWPAAMVHLVSSLTLKTLHLVSEYALDCAVVVGWLKTDTGLKMQIKNAMKEDMFTMAMEAAARLLSLHCALSAPADNLTRREEALEVYSFPVNVLSVLVASKPGRFLGSSDEFDPSVLEGWFVQVISRLLVYLTASEETGIPRCGAGLLKAAQSGAALLLLEMTQRSSAALEYVRGQSCATLGLSERAKAAFCRGACLLDRRDEEQFSKGPWQALTPGGSGDAPLYRYSKLATRSTQAPALKGAVAIATFWPEQADYMGDAAQWTYLFQVLVKLRRHAEVFALLMHHIDDRLPEHMEAWLREMLLEGSVVALYMLPLHPQILSCALSVLETMAMNEAFDLLVTLCSPRYRDQTSSIFLSTFGAETRRPDSAAALTAHMALYTLSLGVLQYRLAAKAMYHHYDSIQEFVKTASCQDRERWFLLFLQREALLLCTVALNCLPEAQAWFVAERTATRGADAQDNTRRELVTREEAQRLVCRIKRELDKVG